MKTKVLNPRMLFPVCLTILILSSCEKNEPAPAPIPVIDNDIITGTWKIGTTNIGSVKVGNKTLSEYINDLSYQQRKFRNIGLYQTLIISSFMKSFTGTIQIGADNTYSSNMGGTNDSGKWSLNSSKTHLTLVSSSGKSTIFRAVDISVTENNLIRLYLYVTGSVAMDLNNDSVPEGVSVDAVLYFEK
jgi:hypothetical protein